MPGACFSLSDSFTPESFVTRSTRACSGYANSQDVRSSSLVAGGIPRRDGKRRRVRRGITRVPLPLFLSSSRSTLRLAGINGEYLEDTDVNDTCGWGNTLRLGVVATASRVS